MSRDDLVALLHALSGLASMAVSLVTKTDLLAGLEFVKPAGMIVFCSGMLLFALAAAQLGRGFWGSVQPVSDRLVTGGPYRLVRHPAYLGMILSVVGLAAGMRSVWGVATCVVIFVPLGIHRARLEERMLAEKYGAAWEAYSRGTYFLFPPIY
jgi:protein-S-isoprenylcysteine O-methyltransferase Ste14